MKCSESVENTAAELLAWTSGGITPSARTSCSSLTNVVSCSEVWNGTGDAALP